MWGSQIGALRFMGTSLLAGCERSPQIHSVLLHPQTVQPTANLDRTDDQVYLNVMELVRAVLELKDELGQLPPENYVVVVKVGTITASVCLVEPFWGASPYTHSKRASVPICGPMKPTFGAPFSPECGPDSAEAHRQRGQPSAFPATGIKD